jgi:hypothetical protein
MRNLIPLSLASLLLVAVTYQNGLAQQNALQSSAAAAEERSNREQDGLEGPVRRVRVETAKMIVKAGNLVEGPKVESQLTIRSARRSMPLTTPWKAAPFRAKSVTATTTRETSWR